jgi:NAD(P)-dependent dehydrogenase (short-subunit alcohol dehydrogenase family)
MAQARWDTRDMPDLTGKVAVVTGANSGLGLHTASALAAKGAHVVMACRNKDKAWGAMAQIRAETPAASIEFLPLNLASLASAKGFGEAFAKRHKQLDLLCNNAGVMFAPRGTTEDGFETHFGTNHLGHFVLTA